MDSSSINANTFVIKAEELKTEGGSGGGESGSQESEFRSVEGIITYNNNTVIFKPKYNLAPETYYTVTIKKDVKDLAGNILGIDYS